MLKVKIIQEEKTIEIESEKGKSLLQIIRENNFTIFAPCGGNGTCGKCTVHIKDEGHVSSCVYYPDHDIEVYLPDHRESQILTTQYEYSSKVPMYPGDSALKASYPLGIAIDIGTSTLVFYLINLITGSIEQTHGKINPQSRFGADVISRIQYCSQPGGLGELKSVLLQALNEELKNIAKKSGVGEEQIVKITIAGNTTMLHILLGVDPTPLALAPFTPVFTESKKLSASAMGICANEDAEVYLLPSISAYVGADIVSGLASLSPPGHIKNYLFIDIGTNGEIALVMPGKILTCATAAGPAFEGANISCGMGAYNGAISVFEAEGKYSTIGFEAARGICGSGLIDIVSYLVSNGLLQSDGLLFNDFIVSEANEKHQAVKINQHDIREVQLAKAAIYAGISILVKSAGLDYSHIDALFLAGGFGNYINIQSAINIGLLPEELKDKIIPIGNSSGTGATLALKSIMFEKNIEGIIEKAEYIELSGHEDFVLEYAMSMDFPKNSH